MYAYFRRGLANPYPAPPDWEGEEKLNWPQHCCLGSIFPEKINPRRWESEKELRLFYPLKERNSVICMFRLRIIEWANTVHQLPAVIDWIPIVEPEIDHRGPHVFREGRA